MNLIGLSGKIGTGKTAVAERLVAKGYIRRGLASSLKEEVAAATGIPLEWCDSQTFKLATMEQIMERGRRDWPVLGAGSCSEVPVVHFYEGIQLPTWVVNLRTLLQWWGTDYRRWQDPDYWVKSLRCWLHNHVEASVVVDDVRFPNEADLIHEMGGLLVRLEPFEGWEPGPHAGHPSETALDSYPRWHRVFRPEYGGLNKVADGIAQLARLRGLSERLRRRP